MSESDKRLIVDSITKSYEDKCQRRFSKELEALYIFGSYAFGKISIDLPDLNYFLLVKEDVSPDVFLEHAELLKELCNEFKGVATVMPDFRPSRNIYPTFKGVDFDVSLNTQYARMEDRHGPVPFGWGWVLQGLLQSRRLIFGRDALSEVNQPATTREYIKTFFAPTFSHIWLALERAPFQYRLPEESHLLLHEARKVAQMASIGFGVTLALNEEELAQKKWLEFSTDKDRLVRFYAERYDEATAADVALMLNVRENWTRVKHDADMAIKMYKAAVEICTKLKRKHRELMHARHEV